MQRMNRKYIPGNRWVKCDICGYGYRFSQMRKGIMPKQKGYDVCPPCFDEMHPNEGWKLPPKQEGKLEKVR
jgi:hypothetical protein